MPIFPEGPIRKVLRRKLRERYGGLRSYTFTYKGEIIQVDMSKDWKPSYSLVTHKPLISSRLREICEYVVIDMEVPVSVDKFYKIVLEGLAVHEYTEGKCREQGRLSPWECHSKATELEEKYAEEKFGISVGEYRKYLDLVFDMALTEHAFTAVE